MWKIYHRFVATILRLAEIETIVNKNISPTRFFCGKPFKVGWDPDGCALFFEAVSVWVPPIFSTILVGFLKLGYPIFINFRLWFSLTVHCWVAPFQEILWLVKSQMSTSTRCLPSYTAPALRPSATSLGGGGVATSCTLDILGRLKNREIMG